MASGLVAWPRCQAAVYCCVQFRALSDQLYRSPGYYGELRHAAVEHLRKHLDMYAPYVEGSFEDYCRDMSRDGTWGDHITLQVSAHAERQPVNSACS